MTGPGAEIRDLSFSVPARAGGTERIIDIGRLALAPGRMTALCGPSGSGKSTLLYILSGLLVPDTGAVLWNGRDIARLGESRRDSWRRREAGFVFQNFHLIPELSPLDNVRIAAWFTAFSAARQRAPALALLARFGVPADRGSAGLLSRGEQQRVAIARALLFDPKVIFADEPTASLDSVAGAAVAATLLELAEREGRTVIVASHDPAVISLAHDVVMLERGRIKESVS